MFDMLLDRIDKPTPVADFFGLNHWFLRVISNHVEKQTVGIVNGKIIIDMLSALPPVFSREKEGKIWQSVKALFETLPCAYIGIVESIFIEP